jgi:cytosine/adenosine deaminase-related metal-dependent hydrolase
MVLDGCTVVTTDAAGTEYPTGHVGIDGDRITAVGAGSAPGDLTADAARVVDARGCVVTPGLVNTHHHLYQWVTRGYAADATLFDWLSTLYPVWSCLDEEIMQASATAGLGWLARTGCTTTMDHHYVFPHAGGDLLAAGVAAAGEVGLRFLPTRGSMDLGHSQGGLPPDQAVEDLDSILAASAEAVDRYHDPSPDSMLRIGLAPCSPFSVTGELLKQVALLARDKGVRLHTHLAETVHEEAFCREHFDSTPVEYLQSLGWMGTDVWFAHGVHLDDKAIATIADTGVGVAHCPSSNARLGAGICRSRDLRAAGVPVGLGVDGAASNEASSLLEEVRHALLFARATGGPQALSTRDALRMATIDGARALGWDDQIGSLEPGKLADLALWQTDTLPHADIADPAAALVLGSPPPLKLLLVGGTPVVENDRLVHIDEEQAAGEAETKSRALFSRAGWIG